MKFFITGIPGTGKTTIGNYLKNHNSFIHFDFENKNNKCLSDFQNGKENFLKRYGDNVVITWGFPPNKDGITDVIYIKEYGNFKLFWFEGNIKYAKETYLKREKRIEAATNFNSITNEEELRKKLENKEKNFDAQIEGIRKNNIPEEIKPVKIIDPFNNDGTFKTCEEILKMMTENLNQDNI